MDEAIILFMKYRESKTEYLQLHKIHFLKRRRLRNQIKSMEEEIQSYNTADRIYNFVNGIYILLSTILYDKIYEDKQFEHIHIVNQILSMQIGDTDIWFMAKNQWFQISEPDLLYSIYRKEPPRNTKILQRWNTLYPQIFFLLYPIISIPITREENLNARETESLH